MAVTFTKLFSSITESTIWCENDQVRLVWITMLAMANKNGFVFGSAPGLANRARVPIESAREALKKFQEPDADSRTKEFDGRRIEEVDGGWRLLNYHKHRAIRDEEERREYMKNLMREKRSVSNVSNVSRHKPPLSQAEAEADSRSSNSKSFVSPTLEEVSKYCQSKNSGIDAAQFWNYYEANGWKVGRNRMKNWKAALGYWGRNTNGGGNGTIRESVAEARSRKNAEVLKRFGPEGSGE